MSPERDFNKTIPKILNSILERLRIVERIHFNSVEEVVAAIQEVVGGMYTWQSARLLTTGAGLRFYVEWDGEIEFVRADRSSGDGTTTATLDVLKNGVSIFTTATKPTVLASAFLGDETEPDDAAFEKGDYFQVEIEATGGGTGPLRLTFALAG